MHIPSICCLQEDKHTVTKSTYLFPQNRYSPLKHVIDPQRAITGVFIDKRAVLLEIVSHETLIAIFNFVFFVQLQTLSTCPFLEFWENGKQ